MKKLISILMMILLAAFVLAQVPTPEQVFTEESMLKEIQAQYNQQRQNVPEFLINLFGNEKINVYMNGYTAHLITVNGEMTDASTGGLEGQTMDIHVYK